MQRLAAEGLPSPITDAALRAWLTTAPDEAVGALLRDAAAVITPYELGQVGRFLAARPAVSDAVKAGYGAALGEAVKSVPNKRASELYPWSTFLDAGGAAALLQGASKRPAVFARMVAVLCVQGQSAGAEGLAAMLDDKKLGPHAAVALASLGDLGVAAARRFLDGQGKKPSRGAPLARTLVDLPAAPVSLWAGEHWSLPRFGRNPSDDLCAPQPLTGDPRHAPTPLPTLEAALLEKPAQGLLPREGWADLLQLVAEDPGLRDVPAAYARCLARGVLGRGDDPAAMVAALDALRWDCAITKHYPAHEWGVGWALLWAGATPAVYRHAIGRFEATRVNDILGARERHFTKALDDVRPPWAAPVHTLLKHYGANIHQGAWRGAPPVLASLTEPAARVELPAETADLWIVGAVEGADRFTVRFRGDVTVTVDVANERWEVSGPVSVKGATPPLGPSRAVRFCVEMARDGMYLAVDGAAVHPGITKLPAVVSPVRVEAEGDGARVTSLTLHAKYTVRAAEAASALLVDLDVAQGYAEVAGQKTPAAAHLLAACALLLEEPRAAMARDALLGMTGDDVAPWQAAVRGEATSAPAAPAVLPEAFAVRSYEDVVRAFQDARLGVKPKARKPAVFKRGQTENGGLEYASFGPSPAAEDWGARTAVPWPAVYLAEEPPTLDNAAYFVDEVSRLPALCRKGRGTCARGSYCVEGTSYLVAALTVEPPDNGYDDDLWFDVVAAAWKVDEGWAWAIMEGGPELLLPLLGLRALPPQVEWKAVDKVSVGNW